MKIERGARSSLVSLGIFRPLFSLTKLLNFPCLRQAGKLLRSA